MSAFYKHIPTSDWSEKEIALAKAVWITAIQVAAALVEDHFDEQEPWITPKEIRDQLCN